MQCKEILKVLEKAFPREAALGFDHVGLQIGRLDKEIQKIYIALDATSDVIEAARQAHADMLLTHHPLIFSPLYCIHSGDFTGRRVLSLAKHDMAYYALHTNYDLLGMSGMLGELLGLLDQEPLEPGEAAYGESCGIGRIGTLQEPLSLEDCCAWVKKKLGLEQVQVYGDIHRQVRRLAVFPGSGKSAISVAVQKGAEVLVTGDIGHHEGIDAMEQGLVVINAGHYGTEYLFMEDMKKWFRVHFPDLEIAMAEKKLPFQIF